MKKITLLIVCLFGLSIASHAQTFGEVLTQLSLPTFKINQKASENESLRESSGMIYSTNAITGSKIFSSYTLYYDELKELTSFNFEFKEDKKAKNLNPVLDVLRKSFGKESDVKFDDISSILTYKFSQGNNIINLKHSTGILPSTLNFTEIKNYKVKIDYDEFNKITTVKPLNVQTYFITNDKQKSYNIEFSGAVEAKVILMKISYKDTEWRFLKSIQILLDDSSVTTLDLKSKQDYVSGDIIDRNNFELGITQLDDKLTEAILKSKIVKLRIIGDKRSGDLTVSDNFTGLKILADRIYK
jgi:hypothetical protein